MGHVGGAVAGHVTSETQGKVAGGTSGPGQERAGSGLSLTDATPGGAACGARRAQACRSTGSGAHLGSRTCPGRQVPRRTNRWLLPATVWLWGPKESVVLGPPMPTSVGGSQCWGAGERGQTRGRCPGLPGNPHGAWCCLLEKSCTQLASGGLKKPPVAGRTNWGRVWTHSSFILSLAQATQTRTPLQCHHTSPCVPARPLLPCLPRAPKSRGRSVSGREPPVRAATGRRAHCPE